MKPLYGVTHDPGGQPIVIEPRTTKVGIGLPKGAAVYAYIDRAGKWCIVIGKEISRFDTKAEAQKAYRAAKTTAPERKYPSKAGFFLFTRVASDGSFEPDWEAIEAHGSIPTEIDIVFVKDDPLEATYQFWTATQLKCSGDGKLAQRILAMASTDEEKKLADAAAKKGERTFPVTQCWLGGCPYAKPTQNNGKEYPAACRPHGRLVFQLIAAPRLGGTAYFDTTGLRSINQLFSCIEIFRTFAGHGDPLRGFVAGIPLKLVLRPYRTSHNGKATTQYGVSLEFRAESAASLKRNLIAAGAGFRAIGTSEVPTQEEPPRLAAAIAAEFAPADQPANEPGADDAEDYGDPVGELAGAWEDDQPPGMTQTTTVPAQQPPVPLSIPTPAQPTTQEQPVNPKWKAFYLLCRDKGMTDKIVTEYLGSLGYEAPAEVPEKKYPELMRWAETWSPAQKSLL